MSLGVIEPPALSELLRDPIFKPYLLRTPRLPAGARTAEPWRVWGIRHDLKWAGKLFPTYADAFVLVKSMLRDTDKYQDVVVTCRPVAFGPPEGFRVPTGLDWCGYCRRPTVYRRTRSHVAMKKWPVISDDDVKRCYYCAARGPQRVFHR